MSDRRHRLANSLFFTIQYIHSHLEIFEAHVDCSQNAGHERALFSTALLLWRGAARTLDLQASTPRPPSFQARPKAPRSTLDLHPSTPFKLWASPSDKYNSMPSRPRAPRLLRLKIFQSYLHSPDLYLVPRHGSQVFSVLKISPVLFSQKRPHRLPFPALFTFCSYQHFRVQ